MKKKLLYTLAALAITGASANAQSTRCHTMENLERLKLADPGLESRMQKIENQSQQVIAKSIGQGTVGLASIINIPVVVHVVYSASSQNISDAQIQSQINILNNDFRRLNADKVNTPSGFTGLAADAEITFCLAAVSPTGAATNGITRTSTGTSAFSDNDAVKYTSQGGRDAWPTDQYLNIWVCNMSGGILGYAQFPGGPAATDGVVVLYNGFGNTGNVSAPYNKGRSATHEIGHWLNLRHIWGDANCGNDLVNDTPVQTESNYGCPSHPKSNSCGASAEMFMNYMDYTDDACMNMFSTGQKSRMRTLFAAGGARASLLSSGGCGGSTPPPPPPPPITTTSTTVTIGNGTAVTGAAPYGTSYMDEKVQFTIMKSELIAAGYSAGNNILNSLAFNVYSASNQPMTAFTIKMRHTTANSFANTSYYSSANMTTVYSANYTAVAGWNTHTFSTPFTYNGTNNILVEICWNNSSSATDSKVYCTTTPNVKTLYKKANSPNGGICETTTGGGATSRPNMRLVFSGSVSPSTSKLINYEEDLTEQNQAVEIDFSLYPNPSNSAINITYDVVKESSRVEVVIYNMMGSVIGKYEQGMQSEGSQQLSLDVVSGLNISDLPEGIYLCSLRVDDTVQTKRFVVKH